VKKAIKKVITEALSAASHSNEELVKQEMRRQQDVMMSQFALLDAKQAEASKASATQLKALQASVKEDLQAIKGGVESVLVRVDALKESQESMQRSLDTVGRQAALGNEQCRQGLAALEQNLKDTIESKGQLQLDALEVLGADLAGSLRASFTEILSPTKANVASNSDVSAAAAVQTDLLRELLVHVQDVQEQSRGMAEELGEFRRLARSQYELVASLEAGTNLMPHSFVILPEAAVVDEEAEEAQAVIVSPCFHRLTSCVKRVVKRVVRLGWEKSRLVFFCPVTLKQMKCGPKGGDLKGYVVKVPTALLRTIVPALKWGVFFLRIALATQVFE